MSFAQDQAIAKKLLRFDRTINFVIDDDEMLPGKLTLPAGQYRFTFRNNFVANRLTLAIDDDKGKNLLTGEIKERRASEDLIVNLNVGKHIAYVRQRPKWRCEITVTERPKG